VNNVNVEFLKQKWRDTDSRMIKEGEVAGQRCLLPGGIIVNLVK
jgi:hypothetical protein